ncbi:MAG: hypothetical protein ACODAJ_07920, partial [Planctomycetota bacterium]
MRMGLAAVALAAALCVAGSARAELIAADSFVGANRRGLAPYDAGPGAGDITPQDPAVPGFSGPWSDGTQGTGTFEVRADGLDHAVQEGEEGGRVRYNGYEAGVVNPRRRVFRSLEPYSPIPGSQSPTGNPVFYLSGLARLDTLGDTNNQGTHVAGFYQNKNLSDSQFFDQNAAKDQEGLGWGFQYDATGELDLVLRHRYDPDPATGNQGQQMLVDTLVDGVTLGETYFVVAKVEMNAISIITTGNDSVSVWVNPADIVNEAAAGSPTATFTDFALSEPQRFERLVFASEHFGNVVSYDEMRLGSAWGDVAVLDRPVASESFNAYPAGTNVNTGTLTDGAGWDSEWINDGGTGTFSVEDPGTPLRYDGTGVSVIGGRRALRALGFGTIGGGGDRSVSRDLDGQETGDVFASFLVRWDG